MNTTEQLRAALIAKQAADLEKLTREHETTLAIMGCLPDGANDPAMVHAYPLHGYIASVHYKVKGAADVWPMLKRFADTIREGCIVRDCGTSMRPTDPAKGEYVAPIWAWLEIDKYSAKAHAFAHLACGIVRVDVEVTNRTEFGQYRRDDPRAKLNYKLQFEPVNWLLSNDYAFAFAAVGYRGEDSARRHVYTWADQYNFSAVWDKAGAA